MDLRHLLLLSVEGNTASARDDAGDDDAAAASPGPAGVVALYAPVGDAYAGNPAIKIYPVSSTPLCLPADGRSVVPRVGLGLMGELVYGPAGLEAFEPRLFCAMDVPLLSATGGDASLVGRMNWGPGSVGVSDALQFVDHLGDNGVLGRGRLAGWIERDGRWLSTAADCAVASLGVRGKRLAEYVAFTLAHQIADGPWDALGDVVAAADRPPHVLVCAGVAPPPNPADPVVVQLGDTVNTVVYDPAVVSADQVLARLQAGELKGDGVSALSRAVVAGG